MRRQYHTTRKCNVVWFTVCLTMMMAGCAEKTGVYTPVNLQPVNFWWHFNPSKMAAWDYFSPIPDEKQPITILQREGPLPEAPPVQQPQMATPPPQPRPVFPPGYGVYP